MIKNISAGLIQTYINFRSKTKLTPEEMFKMLSLELGGDGEKITKKQLDDYIKKAESGQFKNVSEKKISLLRELQKNWDTISNGKDNITLADFEKYLTLLTLITASGADTSEESDTSKKTSKNDYLKELMEKLNIREEGIKKSDLTTYLKSLISEDTNEEEIALVTNLIADFETFSSGTDSINSVNESVIEA